jgi:opacity protein-like surface antigen
MSNKKLKTACITALLLSTTLANAADFGARLGMERTKHECKFSNTSDFTIAAQVDDPDITSATIVGVKKTKDCDNETKPTIGIFAKNKLPNNLFLETEIAYVSKRDFNSTYDVDLRVLTDDGVLPTDETETLPNNTQKLKVKSFPRLLLSLGSDINLGNFIISPVAGVGYAQIKASGDQNSGQFIMREKTNNNFIWNVGASFSIPKSSWSVDYRYIDYGKVETQATQHPLADAGSEKLHGNMSSHTVSLSYLF